MYSCFESRCPPHALHCCTKLVLDQDILHWHGCSSLSLRPWRIYTTYSIRLKSWITEWRSRSCSLYLAGLSTTSSLSSWSLRPSKDWLLSTLMPTMHSLWLKQRDGRIRSLEDSQSIPPWWADLHSSLLGTRYTSYLELLYLAWFLLRSPILSAQPSKLSLVYSTTTFIFIIILLTFRTLVFTKES